MRIVVATTSYPEGPGHPAGHFVEAHARELAITGAEVLVLAPGTATREARVDRVGEGSVRVTRLGGASLFGWPGAGARARERPSRLLLAPGVVLRARAALGTEGPFDRAIAHWIVPGAFPLLAGVRAPLEVVAHGADVRLLCAAPSMVRSVLVSRLLARGATFRFVATALLEELAAALSPAAAVALRRSSRVEPAPILVPIGAEDPRERLGLSPQEPYVAWVGRMVEAKRPHLALEAARAAGVRLVLAGDGPNAASVAAAVRAELGPGPRPILTGLLPRDVALAVVAQSAALLHTSASEGAPTVIREARAMGVPVVACASGDVALWASRDPGIVVALPDRTALAAALTSTLARRGVVPSPGANA